MQVIIRATRLSAAPGDFERAALEFWYDRRYRLQTPTILGQWKAKPAARITEDGDTALPV
jgi:hypothetical protein